MLSPFFPVPICTNYSELACSLVNSAACARCILCEIMHGDTWPHAGMICASCEAGGVVGLGTCSKDLNRCLGFVQSAVNLHHVFMCGARVGLLLNPTSGLSYFRFFANSFGIRFEPCHIAFRNIWCCVSHWTCSVQLSCRDGDVQVVIQVSGKEREVSPSLDHWPFCRVLQEFSTIPLWLTCKQALLQKEEKEESVATKNNIGCSGAGGTE